MTHEQVALAFMAGRRARNARLVSTGSVLWLGAGQCIATRTPDGLVVIAQWRGRSASIVKTTLRRAAYQCDRYAVVDVKLSALPDRPADLLALWNAEVDERTALGLMPMIWKGTGSVTFDPTDGGKIIDLMEALKASLSKTATSPATAQTPANPSPDIGGKTRRPVRAVRAPEPSPVVKWMVPVCWLGKEIDGIIVSARTAAIAKQLATPEYAERGYLISGYSLGEPYTDEAL